MRTRAIGQRQWGPPWSVCDEVRCVGTLGKHPFDNRMGEPKPGKRLPFVLIFPVQHHAADLFDAARDRLDVFVQVVLSVHAQAKGDLQACRLEQASVPSAPGARVEPIHGNDARCANFDQRKGDHFGVGFSVVRAGPMENMGTGCSKDRHTRRIARMARRQEQQGSDLGPFVVIAIGAGVLLWLLPKTFPRAFVATPSVGPSPETSRVPSSAASHPIVSLVHAIWRPSVDRAVVSLLSQSPTARKAYLFQAGMYSFYQTEERPDGKNGPVTRSLLDREAQALGTMNSFATVNDTALLNLANALRVLTDVDDLSQAHVRVVPGALPQGLINQINSEGLRVAADIPLLQMEAA